jgi:hypothetical protein
MKRFNLFDAAIGVFVIVLIPIAYGTYLLFRTPQPVIASVTRVDIGKEERRVGGPNLVAKMKVKGSGLRPLLRAAVDDAPAIGFVFENPNSADLLLGPTKPGSHDLVLYDGVQEVARAPKAVNLEPVIERKATLRVRLESPPEVAQLIKVGDNDNAADAAVTSIEKDSIAVRVAIDEDLKPGVPFTLTTQRYVVKGTVISVSVEQP